MAEQQKRERKANWTVAEVNCLLENIAIHKSTLNSKCMQTVTTKLKNKIWAGITEAVNAVEASPGARAAKEVQKKWHDLKCIALREVRRKQEEEGIFKDAITDGPQKKSQYSELVLNIMGYESNESEDDSQHCHANDSALNMACVDQVQVESCTSTNHITSGLTPNEAKEDAHTAKPAHLLPAFQTHNFMSAAKRKWSVSEDEQLRKELIRSEIRKNKAEAKKNEAIADFYITKENLLHLKKTKLSLEIGKLERELEIKSSFVFISKN